MKNKSTRKHCKEENKGSSTGKHSIIFFVLCFLFLFANGYAQFSIGGFCNYNDVPIPGSFDKVTALYINNDQYADIVCYTPGSNELLILPGKSSSEFHNPISASFPFPISSIGSLSRTKSGSLQCFFISRKTGRIGILLFDKYFNVKLVTSYKTEGNAANFLCKDIDADGKKDIILYGVAYNGLSIFREENNSLTHQQIHKSEPYTKATFIHLNEDHLPDLCAFSALSNKLHFFMNQGNGNFELLSIHHLHTPVQQLLAKDTDNDYLDELIITSEKELTIFHNLATGEPKPETHQLHYSPDLLFLEDVNLDSYVDILYFNAKHSAISVLYSMTVLNERQYSKEVPLLGKPGITDFIVGKQNNSATLIAISDKQKLFSISTLEHNKNKAKILVPGKPSGLFSYNYANDNIADYGYIDSVNSNLVFIINSKKRIPETVLSIPYSYNFSEIRIDEIHPFVKMCYCYSKQDRLIQAILVNMHDFTYWKDFFYVDGTICDVRVNKDDNLSESNLEVLSHSVNKLYHTTFSYDQFHYDETKRMCSVNDFIDITFGYDSLAYLWTKNNGTISLDLFDLITLRITDNIYRHKEQATPIASFSLMNKFARKDLFVAFLSNQKFLTYYNNLISLHALRTLEKDSFSFHHYRTPDKSSLIVLDENTNTMLSFEATMKRLSVKKHYPPKGNIGAVAMFPRKLGQSGLLISYKEESFILLEYIK